MPSTNVDKLKGQRHGTQRFIKRLMEKLEEYDVLQFEPTIGVIENQLEIFRSLNEKITNLTDADLIADELLDTQVFIFDVESKLRVHRHHLRDRPFSSRTAVSDSSNSTSDVQSQEPLIFENDNVIPHSENQNQSSQPEAVVFHQPRQVTTPISITQPPTQNFHQLPKLSLPTFSGDVLAWQAFWDSYESAIHHNTCLTDVQKFNYLKTMLEGEAARTIQGFSLTNANYSQAISLLTERYGEKHKIIAANMSTLLQLPSPPATVQGLRRFYDQLETNIRGLESLGELQDNYSSLLVPVILQRLPHETKRNLAREHGSGSWKLHELRHAIYREIAIMDTGNADTGSTDVYPTAAFNTGSGKTANSNRKSPISPKSGVEVFSAPDCTRNGQCDRP